MRPRVTTLLGRQTLIAPMIAFVFSFSGGDGAGAEMYKSLDELPQQKRGEFTRLYKEYKALERKTADLEKRFAVELPLYQRAKDRLAKMNLRQAELGVERQQYREESVARLGDSGRQLFEAWKTIYGQVVTDEIVRRAADDPLLIPYLRESALLDVQQIAANDVHPIGWDEMRALLPENVDGLGGDKAIDIELAWSRMGMERAQARLEKVEQQLLPSEPMREFVRQWAEADFEIVTFRSYLSRHTPEELTETKKQWANVSGKMTRLWPGWQKPLQEGPYTYHPPKPPSSPGSVAAARDPARRAVFVGVGIVLVAGLALFLYYRRV